MLTLPVASGDVTIVSSPAKQLAVAPPREQPCKVAAESVRVNSLARTWLLHRHASSAAKQLSLVNRYDGCKQPCEAVGSLLLVAVSGAVVEVLRAYCDLQPCEAVALTVP
jgi:hypothetical protein